MKRSRVISLVILLAMHNTSMSSNEVAPIGFNAFGKFNIKLFDYGKRYPEKGDQSTSVIYEGLKYNVHISHLEMTYAPHVSTPYFWISQQAGDDEDLKSEIVYLPPLIEVLRRRSLKGKFFAERGGKLRGFILEDDLSSGEEGDKSLNGILFLHDGNNTSAYSWARNKDKLDIFASNGKKIDEDHVIIHHLFSLFEN